jgi:hypothetical protein
MEEAKIIIDVRNMANVSDRPKLVAAGLDKIESSQFAEIIADDERMLQLAPKIIAAIEKAEFIESWKGEDGFYYTRIRKR